MAGVNKRHQKHMRKTKAQLVEELEALEREPAEAKLAPGGAEDPAAIALRESEKRLRPVVENAPAAILLKDTDGRYLMANPKWHEWFNPKGEDISGKTVYHFYDKDHADKVTAIDRKVLKTGKPLSEECSIPLAGGEELHGVLHKFPVLDSDGKTIAVGGIHLDISDTRQAEEALAKSEALFRAVVNNSPTKIHIKDVEGRYILINKEAEKLFGITDEDGRGKTSYDLFPKKEADAFMAHDKEVIESGQSREEEEEFILEDGLHTFLTVKFPIYDQHGISGVGAIGTDITERKRAEDALKKAKEQAEYASRAKTDFLANMSHELRTPLNSILGFSEVLMREILGPHGNAKYKEYAEDIHYSGTHLLRLINEVLDLSKLEAGEIAIAEDEIDVAEVIKTCVKMVEGRSSDKETCLSTIFPAGLPGLRVDELRFKQILLNLLSNAIKFTPTDGEVTASARVKGDGRYVIEVADTGFGIAAADIPKVLEPFGQVDDVLTRNYEGSGLGLHLAKSFTEMHGGVLEIKSAHGEGTTVILTFPKERTVPIRQKKRA